MPIISPLQVLDANPFTRSHVYKVNGVPFDFTGYAGTWTIKRGEFLLLSGILTLTAQGEWTASFDAGSTAALHPVVDAKGYTLPGVKFLATVTNGADTLYFQAAVQLYRDKTTFPSYAGGEYAVLPNDPEAMGASQIVNITQVVEDVIDAQGLSTPRNVFRQADYMHADDLAKIRAGVTTGQDVARVTAGMRALFEAALSYMFSANGAVAVVSLEAGATCINDSVTSPAFMQRLWDQTGRANSRMEITANGPAAWVLSGWAGGQSKVRTDGLYGALGLSYAVPVSVFEWANPTGLQYLQRIDADITIFGESNAATDPVGFRFYRVNGLNTTGSLKVFNLRNTAFNFEGCFNSTFDGIEPRGGSGWQPTESGMSGLVPNTLRYSNSGATVTVVDNATGAPVTFWEDRHVGLRIALDRQGVSQTDSEEVEAGRRGAKWFTITAVNSSDRSKCTVSPTPSFNAGDGAQMVRDNLTFSFAAIRATTTVGSAVVTLSAPVADSLVGKTVAIFGAGYSNTTAASTGEILISTVTAHSGASITLAHAAGYSKSNTACVVSPQVLMGTMGPCLLHSSYKKNDDLHFRRLWTENGQFGVVPLVMQDVNQTTISDDSKIHGCGTGQNNFGGNFADVMGSWVKIRVDAAITHGLHSPYFGKLMFCGKRVSAYLTGSLSSWTADTDTARWYLDPIMSEADFECYDGFVEYNQTFPSAAGGQVIERGTGEWANQMGLVLRDLPMIGDHVPYLPPTSTALINAAALSGVKHVTLRQVLGSAYTEAQDASAILNAVTPALASAGLTIINDEALSLSLKTRLQMCDDFRVDWGPAILWLDFSSHHAITHDTTYDAGQSVNRVWWRGGRIISRSTSIKGHVFQFDAADSVFEDFSIDGYSGGMAFVFAGTDLVMRNIRTKSAGVDTGGDDAFHLESGARILCIGLHAECADDCFIAGPSPHFTSGHPRFGIPLTDVQYVGCTGVSTFARLCVVSLGGFANLGLQLDNEVKRISFSDIKGQASEGCQVIGMATRNPSQFDDINFSNVQWYAIDGDGGTTSGWAGRVYQTYTRPGCVGRVTFSQCSFGGQAQELGLLLDAPGATVTLTDTSVLAKTRAIAVNYAADVRINGGRYGVTSATGTPIDVYASGARVTITGSAVIDGVTTNRGGVRCTDGSVSILSATINKASGASNTFAVLTTSPGTAEMDDSGIRGTVDNLRNSASTGVISVFPRSAPVRTGSKITTIASDLAALEFTDLVVLDTEGSASTDNLAGLSAPAWLEPGDIITLAINNAGRTVTVKHNQSVTTGYFPIMTNSGGDLTISSTATRLKLQWTGAQFIDATWAAAGGGSAYNAAFGGTAWEVIDPTISSTVTVTSSMVRFSGATTATVTQIDGLTSNVALLYIRNTGPAVTLVHDLNKLRLTGGVNRVLAQYEGMILARVNSTIWGEFGDGSGSVTAFTVATLPAASSATRKRFFVTDATATTFYSVVSGGGSNQVPVWSDGTNWRIG